MRAVHHVQLPVPLGDPVDRVSGNDLSIVTDSKHQGGGVANIRDKEPDRTGASGYFRQWRSKP